MCDELIHPGLIEDSRLSRRSFGIAMAAVAGAPGAALALGKDVVETDVSIKTPDGTSDAVVFHPPGKGTWPAVLIWPDIMGLRPAFRDMGRRLASQGNVVLVVNPFYRSKKAPVLDGPINFGDPVTRQTLMGYRAAIGDDGADRDSVAYLAFLDSQPQTNRKRKAGVQGYCMGGSLSFRTAAAVPGRIGAVGSFHGGNGLVTDQPNSPHLLIAKTKASYLICHAKNDDAQKPEMKDALKAAFVTAKRTATVEVYAADHGWCVPGGQVYDAIEAERAWAALTKLYATALT